MSDWRQKTQAAMLSNESIVLMLFLMIAVPAALTLHRVRTPAMVAIKADNPTPYGYTWSLLLFLAPIGMIAFWFLPLDHVHLPKRPFWTTIAVLAPIGFALDFLLAKDFFYFDNHGATLGIDLPARGTRIPIEEYVFYLSGFIAVLTLYVWLDEYWLRLYRPPQYTEMAKRVRRLTRLHPTSVIFGVMLVGAAYLYRRARFSGAPGFPGYWAFLVATAIVPSVSLFSEVKTFINWRAFSFTLFVVLLISLFWEATLAVPYRWWGYNPRQMMGLSIGAWAGLPVEAVSLWIAVSYTTVIVFEAIRICTHSDQRVGNLLLFGPK
jgi:hypothetical protein